MSRLWKTCSVMLLAFALSLLLACGGGGGDNGDDGDGGGNGTGGTGGTGGSTGSGSDDFDSDGYVNSVDVDDDNDGLIEIDSLEKLDWMRYDLAGTSLTDNLGNVDATGCPVDGCNGYELVNDLDFDTNNNGVIDASDDFYNAGAGWLPVGKPGEAFTGNFHGNDYRIVNLFINRPFTDPESSGNYLGLFGYINGSSSTNTISNLELTGGLTLVTGGMTFTSLLVGLTEGNTTISDITVSGTLAGQVDVGGIAGSAKLDVSLSNVTADVQISSLTRSGVLVGSMYRSYLTQGEAHGSIQGIQNVGGVVGLASSQSQISETVSYAVVSGQDYIGGIAGTLGNDSSISRSASHAEISGVNFVGGIAGRLEDYSSISRSASYAEISGVENVGGLVGRMIGASLSLSFAETAVNGSGDNVGGLVGYMVNNSSIQDVYSNGTVSGGGNAAGGLVGRVNTSGATGFSSSINSAFSTADVNGQGYVGGAIGISYLVTIRDVFSSGSVTGVTYVGGLIGDANVDTELRTSFAVASVSGTNYVGRLVGWSDGTNYAASSHASDDGVNPLFGQLQGSGNTGTANVTLHTLADLQCPTDASDATCTASTLYGGWSADFWDWGTNAQLPGLRIDGDIYRDGDGDGTLD